MYVYPSSLFISLFYFTFIQLFNRLRQTCSLRFSATQKSYIFRQKNSRISKKSVIIKAEYALLSTKKSRVVPSRRFSGAETAWLADPPQNSKIQKNRAHRFGEIHCGVPVFLLRSFTDEAHSIFIIDLFENAAVDIHSHHSVFSVQIFAVALVEGFHERDLSLIEFLDVPFDLV